MVKCHFTNSVRHQSSEMAGPSTEEAYEAFEAEVGVLLALRDSRSMTHPGFRHIVHLEGAYVGEDAIYLVMECMDGGELFDRCSSGSPTRTLSACFRTQLSARFCMMHITRC